MNAFKEKIVKTKIIFSCKHCDMQYAQWQGQCRGCGDWNSIIEKFTTHKSQNSCMDYFSDMQLTPTTLISDFNIQLNPRLTTGLAEFDRVLGGGLVSDSVVLIGGDPGVGKSTLLLQVLCKISKNYSTLYVTGEESPQQMVMRAQRLQLPQDKLKLLAETYVEQIVALAEKLRPQVMVVDSIQTVFTDSITSAPGGVSQVRESAARLVQFSKQKGIVLFIVSHVTKEGAIAGPHILEHMVDTVLYFEGRKNDSRFRVIRAVKNRFGAINEIGVFAMTNVGLKQVNNPSAIFLSRYDAPVSGSVITVTWEGSRPLLVEIQALVNESHLTNPRRVSVGFEQNRLSMLLATLHRHGGIATYNQDIFVNAVGGLRIVETGSDLAVLLAILSSFRNKPIPSDAIVFGEVGLAGEIRPVQSAQERLQEAAKHGFKRAIISRANAPKNLLKEVEIVAISKLQEALKKM